MGGASPGTVTDNPQEGKQMKSVRVTCFLLLAAVFISGCGYTTGSLFPEHLKTIRIQPFRNRMELTKELPYDQYRFRSYSPHLETDITREVVDRFINDGHLKVVKEEDADLILSGELVDYLTQPVRFGGDNETVEEYRISIVCSVEVRDVKENNFLWKDSRVIGDATYNISGTYAVSETTAISNAVSDLARRIANHTIEGW